MQVQVALTTERADPAYRLNVKLFSARGDRLMVAEQLDVTPRDWSRTERGDDGGEEGHQGAQLVKGVRPVSRLRTLTTMPLVVVATWHHVPANVPRDDPMLHVYVNRRSAEEHQVAKKVEVDEYRLGRQHYEWTAFRAAPAAPK